ncbi:epoxide hydrolase N-terminal domain-containing protein [Streptomyces seoulensis]
MSKAFSAVSSRTRAVAPWKPVWSWSPTPPQRWPGGWPAPRPHGSPAGRCRPGSRHSPFEVSITEAEIVDLRERLRRTRWPEREPVDDWSRGLPLAHARELCRHWAEGCDFGFAEWLNVLP